MRASLSATICLSLLLPAVPTLCNPLSAGTSNTDSIRHEDVRIQPLKSVNTAHPLAVRAPDDTSLCKSDEKICAFWCIPKDQHCGWNDGPHPWPRSLDSPDPSQELTARSPDGWGCSDDNYRCGIMCIGKDEPCNSKTGGWDWWRRSLEEHTHALAARSPDWGCAEDNKRCGIMCIGKDEPCNSETGGWGWWPRSLEKDNSHALAVRSPDWGCAEDNKRCGLLCIPKDEKCDHNYGCSADNKRCGWMCIDKNQECNEETGGWNWWRRSLEEDNTHALAVRSPDWGCAEDNKRCGIMCIPKDEKCDPNYGCSDDNKRCGMMCIDKNTECNSETGGWDWWRRSLEANPHSLAVRSPDGLWCSDDNQRCGWMCISKDEQCCGNQGSCGANEECHKNDNGEYGCCAKGETCTNSNGTWFHGVRQVGNDIKDGVKDVVGGGAADLRPGMASVWMLTSTFIVALML
ncbi:hypothetical protein BDV32DRAFT_134815 [Aspergillus pseudonomiae]|uniref:Uncharacterized protein n=1 Tax=Aspergillus pseudonomiae TaxID=1506151 RepID=A0A5N7DLT7_9EURO|nr:uncharacterized protein BDV37DRAFT_290718 [Aspergillus pseudonomiae]KAB8264932.1 hypothetical protein BDV32DRAFT_134815 [Aspergillus pseudonomiae]KAE8407412.1 hypothetical protein BDV37DRAFT_290718 [Aspergillus pseudonomiae]